MEYDIVIATRNRHHILPTSLSLMLSQNRLTNSLIIVDSSDDHEETIKIAEKSIEESEKNVNLIIKKSHPGTSLQRNIGLRLAKSEIVMFPDDDALWFPNVAESIMNVYEKDQEGIIGSVACTDVLYPPTTIINTIPSLYRMEARDRIANNLPSKIRSLEKKIFPEPMFVACVEKINEKKIPSWLNEVNATVVSGPISGFRMTFRREAISQYYFDEILGRYALYEDCDASLSILQNYLIVSANNAKVYHHRSPEKRTNGFEWGMLHILNNAYVVCKHTAPDSKPRRLINSYSYYKIVRYLLQAFTKYGLQRLYGAVVATRKLGFLIGESEATLAEKFTIIRNECLQHRSK